MRLTSPHTFGPPCAAVTRRRPHTHDVPSTPPHATPQATSTVDTLQPSALALGSALGVPPNATCLLCEDTARGTSAAPLAQLLAASAPRARRLGGQGDWQVVSRGVADGATDVPAVGKLVVEPALSAVQYASYVEPTVLVVGELSGCEDVPEGCVAVLAAGGCPDVLSHSAVRARNMGVVLAACLDDAEVARLRGLQGRSVTVTLTGQQVSVQASG
eukprot:363130-Chlamydomonas_euryale.AAC.6